MIVVWFNNYVSNNKDTYFINTDDLIDCSADAVDAIMGVCHTHLGHVLATADKMDMKVGRTRRLYEVIHQYTLSNALAVLAGGTKGRAHRLDPHHAVVAQLIRQFKEFPPAHANSQSHSGDMSRFDTYFTAVYGYSPFGAKP